MDFTGTEFNAICILQNTNTFTLSHFARLVQ